MVGGMMVIELLAWTMRRFVARLPQLKGEMNG